MDDGQNKYFAQNTPAKNSGAADFNSANNSDNAIEDPEKILQVFKDRLIEDLNLEETSPEQRKEIEDKISKLVNDRILNLILIHLPEDKVAELDSMIGQKSQDEVIKYIMESVPGIQEKIAEELFEIRNDLLEMLRNDGSNN